LGKNCRASDLATHWSVTEKTAKRDIAALKKVGVIEFIGAPKNGYYHQLNLLSSHSHNNREPFLKRPLDIVLSFIMIILSLPVSLPIALAVKMTQRGRVFTLDR